MKKSTVIALFLGIFLVFSVDASVISFYVIETGLPQQGERNRHSMLWENAFLDAFFDAGYIVSNYPMLRLASKPTENIIKASGFDVDEAMEAGIDYVLVAQLDYTSMLNPPGEITFFIFKVTEHLVIYERQIDGSTYRYRSDRDSADELRLTIRELVQFVTGL